MDKTFALVGVLLLAGVCITSASTTSTSPIAFAAPTTGTATTLSSPFATSHAAWQSRGFKQGKSVALKVGEQLELEPTQDSGNLSWDSSDSCVAAVRETGIVTALHPGMTRVTAKSSDAIRSATCIVYVYEKRTQKQARKAILKLKKTYRTGRRWTNSNYYYWQAAHRHCYGCAAFAGIASDTAFGKYAPVRRHSSFSRIRAGDHVRIGNEHSMVVLRKKKKHIVVAEGNYGRTFKWGRKVSYAKLRRQGFYVETRY